VFVEPALLVALLTIHRKVRSLRGLVAGSLLFGITVASLYGLFDLVLDRGVTVEGVTRISGPYLHPNALALMTARGVAFALALAALSRYLRPVLLLAGGVSGLALLGTFSRGAMLAVAVAVLLLLGSLPAKLRAVTLLSGLVGTATLVILAPGRMLSVFGGGSGSLRVELWESTVRMIAARPLLGYGPDQFLYAYLPRYVQPTAWEERFTAHAHNLVLDSWIRIGIIGGAFSLLAVAICANSAARAARAPGADDPLRTAAVVALAAIFVHGTIDNAFYAHDLAMSSWLLAWLAFDSGAARDVEGETYGAGADHRRRWLHWVSSLR
jgi:O-antigen ligase